MKKVLAFTLGTGLATVAMPSFAFEDYLDRVGGYVTATYTKPSNNGLSLGDISTLTPPPAAYPFDRSLFLVPPFEWEYALGISYHFLDTCTRFFAEYDYFNDSVSRNVYGAANILGIGYGSPMSTTSALITSTDVTANAIQTSHEWRFGFRRFIPFGAYFSSQLSAFFEYDKLSQVLNGWNFAKDSDGVMNALYQEMNSQFHGWGPGVGVSFRGVPFACERHFGLFASLATTLIYADNLYNMHLFLGDGTGAEVFAWILKTPNP